MELIKEKWYDARNFKIKELQKLLPKGTYINVIKEVPEDRKTEKPNNNIATRYGPVAEIIPVNNKAKVDVSGIFPSRYWFRIVD